MTNLELILLGILKEGPAHAYNIAQLITERGIRAQTAVGFSTRPRLQYCPAYH